MSYNFRNVTTERLYKLTVMKYCASLLVTFLFTQFLKLSSSKIYFIWWKLRCILNADLQHFQFLCLSQH